MPVFALLRIFGTTVSKLMLLFPLSVVLHLQMRTTEMKNSFNAKNEMLSYVPFVKYNMTSLSWSFQSSESDLAPLVQIETVLHYFEI